MLSMDGLVFTDFETGMGASSLLQLFATEQENICNGCFPVCLLICNFSITLKCAMTSCVTANRD